MVDHNQDPPNPIRQARNKIIAACTELEQSQYNAGFDAGFNSGWDACVRRFTATLSEAEQKPQDTPVPTHQNASSPAAYVKHQQSNRELVLEAITESPGMKGNEVAAYCDNTAFTIPERTVRTCLHRLKKAEKIENIDGRWYTIKDAIAREVVSRLEAEK